MAIKVYKEKQFLVFDYEDGRTAKYDFATKQAIGIKGKPVKDLRSQLSGMTIDELIEYCSDKNYGEFLKYIQQKEPYPISNIGTVLDRVPKYSNYEQLFSAGITNIIDGGEKFKYTINDIPKGLIKLCKEKGVKISNRFLEYYKENPNAYLLAYHLEYISLDDDDIYRILSYGNYYYNREIRRNIYYSYFNKLIGEYGYTPKALLLYIDSLKTYEAIDDIYSILLELYDYANMMNAISDKFDKYPRNFLTTHKIACRNYNRLKKQFSEDVFKKRIQKSLEFKYKDYIFIYPNCTQDIKDEAVQQNNCVASYIDNVIDGGCHILFMRKKDNLDKSLVTIEVRNNCIVQAKGKFNREVTPEEKLVINKWNKRFNKKERIAC